MTKDMDAKLESVRIDNYPSQLIGHDDEREIHYCKYPGCEFETSDGHLLVDHIKQNHPLKEIECQRCHVKTSLEGKRWCEDCIQICEAPTITDEEIAEGKRQKEAAHKRSAKATAEWKAKLGYTEPEEAPEPEEKKEVENMGKKWTRHAKVCCACGKPTEGGYKCNKCKAAKAAKPVLHKPLKTVIGATPRPELTFPAKKSDGKGNKVDLLFSPQEMVKEYKMLDGSTLKLYLMDADIVVKVERVIPEGGE